MAIEVAAATERIGGVLARQAANVGGISAGTMIEGVIPPFRADVAGEFQAMVNGGVTLPNLSGALKGGRRRRRLIEPLRLNTPSQGVVSSIQSVRDKFMEIQHNVEAFASKKEDLSSGDLLKMQVDVMQLAYLNELSSKVADKTSQGAQTLFRNQG
ncbi:MAG: hypothetical protein LBD60_04140 [Puniceicoccales bacterium]|jgi:hypothetical protein|nr:hypothetical protein [Puniceicoccales bacterium]